MPRAQCPFLARQHMFQVLVLKSPALEETELANADRVQALLAKVLGARMGSRLESTREPGMQPTRYFNSLRA